MGIRGELFTTFVTLENRSYFFNVKENRNGDIFLQVVESKSRDGSDFDRHQIAIFEEDMQKFLGGLNDSLAFIQKEKKTRDKAKAEKKAAKEAKYGHTQNIKQKNNETQNSKRTIHNKIDTTPKRQGKVHVVSKRQITK